MNNETLVEKVIIEDPIFYFEDIISLKPLQPDGKIKDLTENISKANVEEVGVYKANIQKDLSGEQVFRVPINTVQTIFVDSNTLTLVFNVKYENETITIILKANNVWF